MAYVYMAIVVVFLAGLIMVAKTMDGEDMEE